jgi:thioredoxin-like negative regulator of GroEL
MRGKETMRPAKCLEAFDSRVLRERKPVLLACLHWGADMEKQVGLLESVSKKCGEGLKTCFLREDSMTAWKDVFGIVGTPTFIILDNGRERGRFLGVADDQSLTDFITSHLPGFGDARTKGR